MATMAAILIPPHVLKKKQLADKNHCLSQKHELVKSYYLVNTYYMTRLFEQFVLLISVRSFDKRTREVVEIRGATPSTEVDQAKKDVSNIRMVHCCYSMLVFKLSFCTVDVIYYVIVTSLQGDVFSMFSD